MSKKKLSTILIDYFLSRFLFRSLSLSCEKRRVCACAVSTAAPPQRSPASRRWGGAAIDSRHRAFAIASLSPNPVSAHAQFLDQLEDHVLPQSNGLVRFTRTNLQWCRKEWGNVQFRLGFQIFYTRKSNSAVCTECSWCTRYRVN